MTLVTVPQGIWWPRNFVDMYALSSADSIDATGEKVAHLGRVYIDGRPSTAKTLSAAGGGSIGFRAGSSVTFADPTTVLDVGIQGVLSVGNITGRPDGVYSVKRTLTGGGITANIWNDISMSGGTGSVDIANGDLIAVVWDMTTRGGVDAIGIPGSQHAAAVSAASTNFPTTNAFVTGWSGSGRTILPNVLITFDDGTLACIDGCPPILNSTAETYSDSSTPDERGMLIDVPWDCEIDGYWAAMQVAGATADFDVKLYSDPLGTPTQLDSLSHFGEQWNSAGAQRLAYFERPGKLALSAGVYGLAVKATGAGSVGLRAMVVPDQACRALWVCGMEAKKITRSNLTGAFAAEATPITLYEMGVRICSLHDTGSAGGGGGGLLGNPGMRGGFVS